MRMWDTEYTSEFDPSTDSYKITATSTMTEEYQKFLVVRFDEVRAELLQNHGIKTFSEFIEALRDEQKRSMDRAQRNFEENTRRHFNV